MWDIGGQEKIRKDWYTYYTHTEFVIIVVDSTDRERLPVTKEELSNMLRHDELKKAAVLIFANKQVGIVLMLRLCYSFCCRGVWTHTDVARNILQFPIISF